MYESRTCPQEDLRYADGRTGDRQGAETDQVVIPFYSPPLSVAKASIISLTGPTASPSCCISPPGTAPGGTSDYKVKFEFLFCFGSFRDLYQNFKFPKFVSVVFVICMLQGCWKSGRLCLGARSKRKADTRATYDVPET